MLKEYLSSLANAFRSKLGITDKINAQNFPDKVNEVYDKGKYDEWSDFWDSIQTSGNGGMSYDYMFRGQGWNDITFKPKYNIKIRYTGGCNVFEQCKITDLEAALARGSVNGAGVKLDLSTATNCNAMFQNSTITIIPELDLRQNAGCYQMFNASSIHTIRKIISSETTQWGVYMFYRNTSSKLANLEVEGVIAKTLTLQYQPLLTKKSIISVINALSDEITNTTISFNKTAINNAFGINVDDETTYTEEWENLRNSKSNWTFAYA